LSPYPLSEMTEESNTGASWHDLAKAKALLDWVPVSQSWENSAPRRHGGRGRACVKRAASSQSSWGPSGCIILGSHQDISQRLPALQTGVGPGLANWADNFGTTRPWLVAMYPEGFLAGALPWFAPRRTPPESSHGHIEYRGLDCVPGGIFQNPRGHGGVLQLRGKLALTLSGV